jgi:hypothetical protein
MDNTIVNEWSNPLALVMRIAKALMTAMEENMRIWAHNREYGEIKHPWEGYIITIGSICYYHVFSMLFVILDLHASWTL